MACPFQRGRPLCRMVGRMRARAQPARGRCLCKRCARHSACAHARHSSNIYSCVTAATGLHCKLRERHNKHRLLWGRWGSARDGQREAGCALRQAGAGGDGGAEGRARLHQDARHRRLRHHRQLCEGRHGRAVARLLCTRPWQAGMRLAFAVARECSRRLHVRSAEPVPSVGQATERAEGRVQAEQGCCTLPRCQVRFREVCP